MILKIEIYESRLVKFTCKRLLEYFRLYDIKMFLRRITKNCADFHSFSKNYYHTDIDEDILIFQQAQFQLTLNNDI